MSKQTGKPNYGIYIIVAGFLAILIVNLFSGSAKVNWSESFAEAEELAKSKNKPLLILFTTKTGDDASTCHRMDYATLGKPDISKYINKSFYPVRLDIAANKELARKYSVTRLPAIVLVLPDSDNNIRLDGFISETEFYPRVSNALVTLKQKVK